MMYEDFVPERLAKLRVLTPQEFFDEGNACPQTLQEFMTEAKKLDSKSMEYILGIMKELNSKR